MSVSGTDGSLSVAAGSLALNAVARPPWGASEGRRLTKLMSVGLRAWLPTADMASDDTQMLVRMLWACPQLLRVSAARIRKNLELFDDIVWKSDMSHGSLRRSHAGHEARCGGVSVNTLHFLSKEPQLLTDASPAEMKKRVHAMRR